MIRIATATASRPRSSIAYPSTILWYIKKRRASRTAASSRWALLDRVDLGEDLLRADLLGVRRHHRVGELLHLVAVGERNALQLAGLLEGVELRVVLRGLDLAAVGAGLLARLQHRGLHVLVELVEGLGGEAQ